MAGNAKAQQVESNKFAVRYGLQETFDKLYEDSKKGKTFSSLFPLIIREDNILLAYRRLRVNKGAHTPGVDGKDISFLDNMLPSELVQKVRNKLNNYHPNAVKRVEIPKPNGKLRPLGIPTIVDRLCQQTLLQILEPICEARFNPHSYGFRPGYSAENAIADLQQDLQLIHCRYVVDVDIKSFFDNIHHHKLMRQLWSIGIQDKKVLKILSEMLSAPIVLPDGTWVKPDKGTPQGGIISPLLANVVLNEFDWWIDSQWRGFPSKHDYGYPDQKTGRIKLGNKYNALRGTKRNPCNLKEVYLVRYADDFKLFCKSYDDAKRFYHATVQWLNERLHLEVSEEKSKITDCKKRYTEFLGFKFKLVEKAGKLVITSHICDKAIARCKKDLKEQLYNIQHPRSTNDAHIEIMLYNAKVRGIHNYYSIATNCTADFAKIGNDLRYIIERAGGRRLKPVEHIPAEFQQYQAYEKQLRVISGNILLPISGVRHRHPMAKNRSVCKYEGNRSGYSEVLDKLLNALNEAGNVKYHTFRISKWGEQLGRCAVLKVPLEYDEIHCHHIVPKHRGGTDEYNNLVIVHETVHTLIHATVPDTIQTCIASLGGLSKEALAKINSYRKRAGNPPISVEVK